MPKDVDDIGTVCVKTRIATRSETNLYINELLALKTPVLQLGIMKSVSIEESLVR